MDSVRDARATGPDEEVAPELTQRVETALRQVIDPELGIDVVDLGLVYAVRREGGALVVEMTLTTPGCPVAESLPEEVAAALNEVLESDEAAGAQVRVVWDPPWTPERLAPEARRQLGFDPLPPAEE